MNFFERIFNKMLINRGYIPKNRQAIQEYLVKIKDKVRQDTANELNKKFEEDISRLKQEHILDVEDKNSTIKHLGILVEDADKRVRDAEIVYSKSIATAKTNIRVASEIWYQMQKITKSVASGFAVFEEIKTQAIDHHNEIMNEDPKNRKLLRIDKRDFNGK